MPANDSTNLNGQQQKRIAFCITDLDPGGAEWALYHIVTRLNPERWQPQVYCLGPAGEIATRLEAAGIPVKAYGARSSFDFRVLFWLKRGLKEFRPLICQGFLFHANIVSRIAAKLAGVPIRIAGHRVAEREKRWHLFIDRLTNRFVQHHVCVSQGVARFLQIELKLPGETLTVIPNGIDVASIQTPADERLVQLRKELNIPVGHKVVLAVGRLHPQKGFDLLIDAFQQVSAEVPQLHLLIVGEGPERLKLETQVAANQIGNQVTLAGFRTEVAEIMSLADLFVLSSRWEGMPNVLLQAMAVGLPIVTTDVEGVSELLIHGKSAQIVKPNDANELRHGVLTLITQPDLAPEFTKEAQAVVVKEFTWESVVDQYDRFYTQIADSVSDWHAEAALKK